MTGRPLTICAIGAANSTHVAARVRYFARLGHRVYLITETRSEEGIEGVTEIVLAPPKGLISFLLRCGGWALARLGFSSDHAWRAVALIRQLRECRPNIVHVHFAYSYYGWLAGFLGCRPLVVTVMGGDVLFDEQGAPTPEGKHFTLLLLQRADYITSKSDYLTSVLDRLGGFGRKAERIVWGISVAEFRRATTTDLRARLGLRPQDRVILSPKILQPLYRVHLVVEAMPMVLRHIPDAVLVVTEYAADPAYKASIAQRAAEIGVASKVRFCGRVPHGGMPEFYSLSEATVAVPSSDGLPQTLLEGMACEVPSILGRLPRYEEIVQHAESAYFVDATPAGIAAGIVDVMTNMELRARIVRNALDIVRREADLDQQARRVEKRYCQLAESIAPRYFGVRSMVAAALGYLRSRRSPDL